MTTPKNQIISTIPEITRLDWRLTVTPTLREQLKTNNEPAKTQLTVLFQQTNGVTLIGDALRFFREQTHYYE